MLSRQQIASAIDSLKAAVQQWEEADIATAPAVTWRGQPRKAVSEEIQQAAVKLFDLCATMDVAPDARAIVLAVDAFDNAFAEWAQDCQRLPDDTDPSGGSSVWMAYDDLLKASVGPTFRKPEPISALVAQKVGHSQIAKIYGWYDRGGAPDVSKVAEEIANPGTHYNPKTWTHPSQRRRRDEVDAAWKKRATLIGRQEDDRPAKASKPATETLEELIGQGVNSKQIAKMLRIPEDEVRAGAAEMGVPLDGNIISDAFYKKTRQQLEEEEIARQAEELQLANKNDHAELGNDIEARILAMHADGTSPKDILKLLRKSNPTLQHQKISAVIRNAADCTPAG